MVFFPQKSIFKIFNYLDLSTTFKIYCVRKMFIFSRVKLRMFRVSNLSFYVIIIRKLCQCIVGLAPLKRPFRKWTHTHVLYYLLWTIGWQVALLTSPLTQSDPKWRKKECPKACAAHEREHPIIHFGSFLHVYLERFWMYWRYLL